MAQRIMAAICLLSVYMMASCNMQQGDIANVQLAANQTNNSYEQNNQDDSGKKVAVAGSLKNIYKDFFDIGAAIDPQVLDDKNVRDFIVQQYSSLTAVNDMKPFKIQPEENRFDWAKADKLVEFARQNNIKVRGHCLIWFYRMPKWFLWQDNRLITKQELFTRMNTHITAVMKRYKGKVYCYDVLNEVVPFAQGDNIYNKFDTLYKIGGQEYVDNAFKFARIADPSAKLYYNDAFYDRQKRDKIYRFVKGLKDRNVPIDGIGIQCHLGIEGMSGELLKESIELFSKLGLEVQITELDVSIFPKASKKKDVAARSDVYTAEIEEQQANIYDMIFRVCREKQDKVTGITLWSPADINNYLTTRLGKKNYPYLFDKQLKPKKAFYKVTDFKAR